MKNSTHRFWHVAALGMAAALAGSPAALGQSLTTTFVGGNRFAGNTFDLVPAWPITVTSWRTNIDSAVGVLNTIQIFTRPGSAAGFAGTGAGWSVFGRDTTVFGNGAGNQSVVGVSGLILRPPATTGVYWDLQSYAAGTSGLEYTNGTPTDYSNVDLTIRSRDGAGSPAFTSVNLNRIWNGRVDYTPTASTIGNLTTLAGGNGNIGGGVTFDVVPERDVDLVSLSTSLDVDPNPYAVSVYFRLGTAAGNANSSAGWTLIGTDPNVVGAGEGNLTRVNVGGVTLRRGQVYGFYVHKVGGGVIRYTNGSVAYNRADLRIISQEGVNTLFDGIGQLRVFNGRLETTPAPTIRKLLTTMAGGNGQDGVMFDVLAAGRAVDVTGFDINASAVAGTTPTYRVYYRTSTSVGAEDSAAGWILAGSDALQANGTGIGSALQFGRVTIPAGQRYGFFITAVDGTTGGVEYTDGSTTFTNGEISMIPNCGKALPLFTGATFSPRIFNGRVQYVLNQCYANCDGSSPTQLSPADFTCFLARYRAGDPYANCDLSFGAAPLSPADFTCFLNAYRAGCP